MLDDTTFKNKLKNLLNNSDKNDFVKFLINDIDKDLHLSYKTNPFVLGCYPLLPLYNNMKSWICQRFFENYEKFFLF